MARERSSTRLGSPAARSNSTYARTWHRLEVDCLGRTSREHVFPECARDIVLSPGLLINNKKSEERKERIFYAQREYGG